MQTAITSCSSRTRSGFLASCSWVKHRLRPRDHRPTLVVRTLTASTSGVPLILTVVPRVSAGLVLASGAGGWLHVALLVLWLGVTVWLALRYRSCRRGWTRSRLALTNDLVERMVGHRTRLAQEAREEWHDGES